MRSCALRYSFGKSRDDLLDDYTVEDFCIDHPNGKYLLAIDGHVVTVIAGFYFDTWEDSGREIPIYYWFKEEE